MLGHQIVGAHLLTRIRLFSTRPLDDCHSEPSAGNRGKNNEKMDSGGCLQLEGML